MDEYTSSLIATLPAEIIEFCNRVDAHPDFRCTATRKNGAGMTKRLHVVFQDNVIGGLSWSATKHWYIYETTYAREGTIQGNIAEAHGFKLIPQKNKLGEIYRQYWQANGYGAVGRFEETLKKMTGADF